MNLTLPPRCAAAVAALLIAGSGLRAAQPPSRATVLDVQVLRTMPAASCAAESLALAGTMRLIIETTPRGADGTRSSVIADLRGITARGLETESEYRLDNNGRAPQVFACAPGERCFTEMPVPFTVRSAGSPDGPAGVLFLQVTADPHGRLTARVLDSRFICRS